MVPGMCVTIYSLQSTFVDSLSRSKQRLKCGYFKSQVTNESEVRKVT